MIQAIGYVRRSTDKQEESLDQQRAKLAAFAQARGWELREVYEDDAISGSDMKRAGLEKLLQAALSRSDVSVVLTWDRNRLARPKDPVDGLLLERELIKAGKRVVYAATGQELDRSFTSGLLSYVEHYQNGDYLRKLSRDTIRGLVGRVQQGCWPGGTIPFGYDRLVVDADGTPRRIIRDMEDGSQLLIEPATGKMLERLGEGRRHRKQEHELCTLFPSDPVRVRAVQRMFADFASGKPSRQLRDELNRTGFRTLRGQCFTVQTMLSMLENPAYTGQCVYNRRTLSKWHRYVDGSSVERLDEGYERRPKSDWIVKKNAWPALVKQETFDQVQDRRRRSHERNEILRGTALHADYLLTGLAYCGVCGGKLTGHTYKNTRGYKTRYYVCSTHHNGHKDRCPKRYTVPAKPVEEHILGLVRADLARLRDDEQLHQYVAEEVSRMQGGRSDKRIQMQRRLAELDQQTAKVREHLLAMDPTTARSLGLYEQANRLAEERVSVERELAESEVKELRLPKPDDLRAKAAFESNRLDVVLAEASLEVKRELVSLYVQTIKADPDSQTIQISLYPALFSERIAGTGLEPVTSRL